jgi:hypothetical protein
MTSRIFLQTCAVCCVLLISSCAKDKAKQPSAIDCSTVDQTLNTYNLKIKTILDDNCASAGCHDPIFAASGINLATYATSRTAFETGKVLCTVNQEQGCLPMPQGGSKLADSLITYISCWADNNYPQ